MSIPDDHLGQVNSPLAGFMGDAMPVEGMITLTVVAGRFLKQSRVQVDFPVVKAPSAYNAYSAGPTLTPSELWCQPTI